MWSVRTVSPSSDKHLPQLLSLWQWGTPFIGNCMWGWAFGENGDMNPPVVTSHQEAFCIMWKGNVKCQFFYSDKADIVLPALTLNAYPTGFIQLLNCRQTSNVLFNLLISSTIIAIKPFKTHELFWQISDFSMSGGCIASGRVGDIISAREGKRRLELLIQFLAAKYSHGFAHSWYLSSG